MKNIESDPYCSCGHTESTAHYFLHCQKYVTFRTELENSISTPISLNLLLYGDKDKNFEFNRNLFVNVHKFIIRTKRFS